MFARAKAHREEQYTSLSISHPAPNGKKGADMTSDSTPPAITPKTIVVDSKIGDWRVVAVTFKRALCRCACGAVHEVSIAALESGASESCGCRPPSWSKNRAINEAFKERRRLKDFSNWKRLERGR